MSLLDSALSVVSLPSDDNYISRALSANLSADSSSEILTKESVGLSAGLSVGLSAKKSFVYSKQTGFYSTEEFWQRLETLGYDYSQSKPFIISKGVSLAVACAGAGKTTAIILNIIYGYLSGHNYLEDGTPKMILVCTFLRSGAADLKREFLEWAKRLDLDLSYESAFVHFSTLDSEYLNTLKNAKIVKVLPKGVFTDLMPAGQMVTFLNSIITEVAGEMHLRSNLYSDLFSKIQEQEVSALSTFYTFLSNRVNKADDRVMLHSAIKEFEFKDKNEVLTFYQKIEDLKAAKRSTLNPMRCYDFVDVSNIFLNQLHCNPKFSKYVRNKYHKIYLDEFQDTSEIQYQIFKYYLEPGAFPKSIYVVGDDDQCIYGWRGSDSSIIKSKFENDFRTDCSKVKLFYLSMNRRCPSNVVNFTIPSIELNRERHPKPMFSKEETGKPVQIMYKLPVARWTDFVSDLTENGENLAILTRTNEDLYIPVLLMELTNHDYYLSNNFRPNARMELVFTILAFWSADSNIYMQTEPLLRALLPGVNKRELHRFYEKLKKGNLNFLSPKSELLRVSEDINLGNGFMDFLNYFEFVRTHFAKVRKADELGIEVEEVDISQVDIKEDKDLSCVSDMIKYFIKVLTKPGRRQTAETKDLCQHLMMFRSIIALKYLKTFTKKTLFKYLTVLLPGAYTTRMPSSTSNRLDCNIVLTTVHDSKGKGWDNVVIYQDVAGHFPSGELEDMPLAEAEEERNLHYIACTRAKKSLYIMTSEDDRRKSPFLFECDWHFVEINTKYNTV